MFHRIECIGRLGRQPEMRYTASGTPVTNFSIACNRYRKDAEGNRDDETIWIRVTTWGNLAETCNEYLDRGRLVFVAGELTPDDNGSPRVWQKQDGSFAASYEMTAREVKFLSPKAEREESEEESPF